MDLFLALTVHRFVTSVGSYAGFASIVGLAILILLFFAQARETNALRDHVDELLDRIAGLESRLARQAQEQSAAQEAAAQQAAQAAAPAPRLVPALAAVGGSRAAFALPPAPPAGVAAPALSAATRVVPLATPAPLAVPVPVPAGRAVTGATGVATAPAPATPAATNGNSHAAPVAVPAGNSGRPEAIPDRAGPSPRPVAAAATSAGAIRRPSGRPVPPGRERMPELQPRRFSRGRIALILALLLAVAAVAVAVVLVSSSSTKTPAAAHQATRRASNTAAQINPRTVTVAVLNGTGTVGLAHRIAQRLGTRGFQTAKPTTAPDQTRKSTTVAYIPGARSQALAVAQALKLGAASVAPVDQSTRLVGCSGSSTCTASVFVTVGADLATQ